MISRRPDRDRRHSLALSAILIAACALGAPGCARPTAQARSGATAGADDPSCCKTEDAAPAPSDSIAASLALDPIALPDIPLIDQDGREVHLARDRIGDRVAAIQFIFTRCATTCPILGGQFGRVQDLLGDRLGEDFTLISVTVDPAFDTPAVLKRWAGRFHAGPGWSLVTGTKPDLDRLLRRLGAASADVQDHQSQVLVYDGATGRGLRVSGLASPGVLASVMRRVRDARPKDPAPRTPADEDAGRSYFTDTVLVDQEGQPRRFYSDLLRDKVVVINVFFSSCKGSCLVMGSTLARLQERLGDRLGRDVRLISITVDCAKDTPDVLASYARDFGVRPGWYMLTGNKPNVDLVLRKIGQYVEMPDSHGAIMLVGNLRTGLWKKVFGLARTEDVIAQVESVIEDGRN